MKKRYSIEIKKVSFLKFPNKFYLLLLVFISCNKNGSDFEFKNHQINKAVNDFIEESNYKALNQSKVIILSFFKYDNDTILMLERTEPYKIENYKGKIKWNGFDLFLYSNLKSNYIKFNDISSENLKYAKERNFDVAYRRDYKVVKGKFITSKY